MSISVDCRAHTITVTGVTMPLLLASKDEISGRTMLQLIEHIEESEKNLPPSIGFRHNAGSILEAWRDDKLNMLQAIETNEAFKARMTGKPLFRLLEGFLLIPAFCIMGGEGNCDILWVHPELRGKGVGSTLVDMCGVISVGTSLDSATGFWDKLGIPYKGVSEFSSYM